MAKNRKRLRYNWRFGLIVGYPAALLAAIIVINQRDPARLVGGIAVFSIVWILCSLTMLGISRWWNGRSR